MLLRDYTLAHARTKVRGIFCLETDWSEVRRPMSVEPMLALLKSSPLAIPFIHRRVATKDGLDYYMKKWTQRAHADHPILYMAFHGVEGEVQFGDLRRRAARVSLDHLEEMLRGKCAGRVIHFGSCATLGVSQRRPLRNSPGEHPRDLLHPLTFVQHPSGRHRGRPRHHLFHVHVGRRTCSHLCEVRDDEDLDLRTQLGEGAGDGHGCLASDSGVHLVEHHALGARSKHES